MLTSDDVAALPLFAELPADELERLARTSADLHLGAGEFAVPEGGERALFAVLSGKIEVVKTFDGVERRLGFRLPGTIFGEVPMALGTPFPGGYRAVEPSRVMRIEPAHYYAIAAIAPEISLKVSALARERIAGGARHGRRPPVGPDLRRAAALSRPQSDLAALADSRRAGAGARLERPGAGRG
jgi:thioredoxin reductase (NADPH)